MSNAANFNRFFKELRDEKNRIQKAVQTAAKVEGFRLSKVLQEDIKNGAIAGKPFEPLREISKEYRGRNKNKPPLFSLAKVVRYVVKTAGNTIRLEIGFTGAISKKWKEIATRQQTGATIEVKSGLRASFRNMGSQLAGKKRSRDRARYFFLKKQTKTFTIPQRDIIDTFYEAHSREIDRNIRSNFERKMRGEKI